MLVFLLPALLSRSINGKFNCMNNKKTSLPLLLAVFVLGIVSFWFLSSVTKVPKPLKKQEIVNNDKTIEKEKTQTPEVPSGKSLDLSGQGLEKLPSSVLSRTDLEELNISNNKLTGALPSEIGKLTKLKVLNASNNLMTGVPAEVGHLPNLEVLDLSNNQLTGLPNELGQLSKLKVLNLSGNNYSKQDLDVIKKGLPSDVNIIVD